MSIEEQITKIWIKFLEDSGACIGCNLQCYQCEEYALSLSFKFTVCSLRKESPTKYISPSEKLLYLCRDQIYQVIKENKALALTSPSPFIRETAQFMFKENN